MTKPTLAFATMCKNEEHCIRQTLDAVAPYISYLVVCDTGSTDRTVQIVKDFMAETGIPGEIHVDEWQGFDKNKTLMMSRAYDKSDYVLHLDADDILAGDFSFTEADAGCDNYLMTLKRGSSSWKATVIYDNRKHWKFCGVAHTTIKCLERPTNWTTGDLSNRGWIIADGIGSRAFDPKKYFYDAEKLKKQFFDTLYNDPDGLNTRSVFYTAQSYMDYGMYKEALEWNCLYLKLKNTWIEEQFEAQMRISICLMRMNATKEEVIKQMDRAIAIFSDRAEPYHHIGKYLNHIGQHELAYQYLIKGKQCSLDVAKSKYVLFIKDVCYGLGLNDELAVACSYTNRLAEGISYLTEIINLPEYAEHKPRLERNISIMQNAKAV
jgi:glycosyltransferase involved in cell wall biosynthesis